MRNQASLQQHMWYPGCPATQIKVSHQGQPGALERLLKTSFNAA